MIFFLNACRIYSKRIIERQRRKRRHIKRSDVDSSGDGSFEFTDFPKTPTTTSVDRDPSRDDPPDVNVPQIDLGATEGQFLIHELRNDTFYDKEDGGMTNLRMKVVESRKGGDKLIDDTWLKIDGRKLILYGVARELDQKRVRLRHVYFFKQTRC